MRAIIGGLALVIFAGCGPARSSSPDTVAPATAAPSAPARGPDELCMPLVSGCGCSYVCAWSRLRNADGTYEVNHDLQDSRSDTVTIGQLCLPDGRCRDAFLDPQICGGECVPTDAHWSCHFTDDGRCIP